MSRITRFFRDLFATKDSDKSEDKKEKKTNFDKLIEVILDFEGGFVDHPDDRGGATNFGLSLRFMKSTEDYELFDLTGDGDITIEDVKKLTREIAIEAYRKYFWLPLELDEFKTRLALILFDMNVNHGSNRTVRMLQESINRISDKDITEDGLFGPQTKGATLDVNQIELCEVLLCRRERFFRQIVANDSSQEVFLNGWINHRIDRLRRISLEYA